MSSDDSPVIARGVQPADRASWEKLFQEYREFYKLPYDPSVCVLAFTLRKLSQRLFLLFYLDADARSRFTKLFGIGCIPNPRCLSTFLTLVDWLPAIQNRELLSGSRIIEARLTL
jgi:hypothetical protein